MPYTVAVDTNLGSAVCAFGSLSILMEMNLRGMNPITACRVGTVEPVVGGVLLVLAVPFLLELQVKVRLDVAEGDALVAALGRHLFRILQ